MTYRNDIVNRQPLSPSTCEGMDGTRTSGVMNELIFILTTRCTQSCRFCCEPPGESDMVTSHAVDWLRHVKHSGIRWVDMSGGEPLLHPDIRTLCVAAHRLGLNLTLSTNGSLLTQHLDVLFPHVNQWNMSLHGMARIHDATVRRAESWRDVIRGCEKLAQRGAVVHITYVVTSENIVDIRESLSTLRNAGVTKLCFNYVFRRGLGIDYLNRHYNSQLAIYSEVCQRVAELRFPTFSVYHNLNLDGQCALLRSNGDIWAVPMSNGQDFERVGHVNNLGTLARSYPFLENHRTFTLPRLGPLRDSDHDFVMTPSAIHRTSGETCPS